VGQPVVDGSLAGQRPSQGSGRPSVGPTCRRPRITGTQRHEGRGWAPAAQATHALVWHGSQCVVERRLCASVCGVVSACPWTSPRILCEAEAKPANLFFFGWLRTPGSLDRLQINLLSAPLDPHVVDIRAGRTCAPMRPGRTGFFFLPTTTGPVCASLLDQVATSGASR
jgi:hypothetical protein